MYMPDKPQYHQQLEGVEKIQLSAGESKQVSFTINSELLEIFDDNGKPFVEAGEFEVFIGNGQPIDNNCTGQKLILTVKQQDQIQCYTEQKIGRLKRNIEIQPRLNSEMFSELSWKTCCLIGKPRYNTFYFKENNAR